MKIKHYLALNAKVLLSYVTRQLICNVMLYFCFVMLTGNIWGDAFCTIAFAIFCMTGMYGVAYKAATKDIKSYSTNKPYHLKGLSMCVLLLAVTAVFFCFYTVRYNFESNTGLFIAIDSGFETWCCHLKFMLRGPEGLKITAYILVFLVPVISTVTGYIAGMYRYELGYKFFSKLVYKKK